jgi:hypothetical protein
MLITVRQELRCTVETPVDVPFEWSQVKGWYVKYDHLHYTFDGETWKDIKLNSIGINDTADVDWSRPVKVTCHSKD